MIACRICIEYIEERGGLSMAIIPTPTNSTKSEQVMWSFFDTIIDCHRERVLALMANNSQRSESMVVNLEARAIYEEKLKALGAGERATALFTVSFSPEFGLLYLMAYQDGHEWNHPLEEQVWNSLRHALDIGTDWLQREEGGLGYEDYEEDQRNFREYLEGGLAKLPVFPKYEEAS